LLLKIRTFRDENCSQIQILSFVLPHGNRNFKSLTLRDADFGPDRDQNQHLASCIDHPILEFAKICGFSLRTLLIPDLEKLCKNSPSESIIYKVYCCLRFYCWQILSLYTFIYFNFFLCFSNFTPFLIELVRITWIYTLRYITYQSYTRGTLLNAIGWNTEGCEFDSCRQRLFGQNKLSFLVLFCLNFRTFIVLLISCIFVAILVIITWLWGNLMRLPR